jgi:phospho-N-acetylmuramoyl-pentapeptide-transferase
VLVHAPAPLVAAVAAAVLTALALPPGIGWLRRAGLVQVVRREGPAAHLAKAGTPMAAGALFVPAACLAAWAVRPGDPALLVCLAVVLGHAALGFADDYLKVVRRRPEGLRARYKLVGQLLLGGGLAVFALSARPEATAWLVPFAGGRAVAPPLVFLVLTVLAVLGSTNGTNFTDGADGLLGSTGLVALAAVGAIVWAEGYPALAALAFALAGALGAFLFWNWYPARVFMGDTGSMAVGAAFVAVGILGGVLLYLPIVGLLFVLEVLSVMAQVAYFRRTGRRLLRMAPLHHHLELSGWREGRLVPRLLVLALAAALVGLAGYWL